MTVFDNSI